MSRASSQSFGAALFAPAPIFTIAALIAIASDVATPAGATIIYVGAALIVLAVGAGIMSFRSGDRQFEGAMAALVLPIALCGYAAFDQRDGKQGRPPSGVIARALPTIEQMQAKLLPMEPETKMALLLEASLKIGVPAAKTDAVGRIPEQKSAPLRKYLYETAAAFGGDAQKQLVAATVLTARTGQSVSVELREEDHTTLFAQYIEGSSIRVTSIGHDGSVHASLGTNKEQVALEGRLAGPVLTLNGKASVADHDEPLSINVTMGRDLTFAGYFRLSGGQDVAVTLSPL